MKRVSLAVADSRQSLRLVLCRSRFIREVKP